MTKTILWVVGEPGVGKTTLVRGLLGPVVARIPKPKWTYGSGVACAGSFTGGAFDGADTVPYNGAAEALVFWREAIKEPLTIFDGDRFSNTKAVELFAAHRRLCVLLAAPEEVVAARRAARGTEQNASWVLGRKTKSRRFHARFPAEDRLVLEAGQSPDELLLCVKNWLKEKMQ